MLTRVLLACCAASAVTAQSSAPSILGRGGARPTEVPNHETRTVTLPGLHLTGAKLRLWGSCRLASYDIVSDTLIRMQVEGVRAPGSDETCHIQVFNARGHESTWIVVNLTPDEEKQVAEKKKAAGMAKLDAAVAAAGKRWQVRFGDGAVETWSARGNSPDGMPQFQDGAGHIIKIAVRPDNSVFVIREGCVLSGNLVNGRVTAGQAMPGCPHAGSWSATVE